MPKTFSKGNAFDKPGPSWQYLQDMQQAGAHRAAMSEETKADTEKGIVARITASSLSMPGKKRFSADVRGALRRVKDGKGATPCTNWARSCDKCKSGRAGDAHHVFCENRGDWKTLPEKTLALQLKSEIELYHREFWRADGGSLVVCAATPADPSSSAAPTSAAIAITAASMPSTAAAPAAAVPRLLLPTSTRTPSPRSWRSSCSPAWSRSARLGIGNAARLFAALSISDAALAADDHDDFLPWPVSTDVQATRLQLAADMSGP